ncbi:phosphatase PAP2 family protein [Streptomyces sp. NPDC052396]|uniref:phosphatase PAP2 family protein n=1 Tax=Streptomyces sp. NPDC052396 TaxID=3365689 RepID=UPI0037D459E0
MNERPAPAHPQHRSGRALAHTGALRSGHPYGSDGRPPHTPRGARPRGRHDGSGTLPPVPGPSAVLLPALCAVLFALIAWQVAAHGPLRALDERLGRAAERSAVPSAAAHFFADLGNAPVALPVLGLALAWAAWRARAWRAPLAATLAMAAVPALVVPLKAWIARPGPPMMGPEAHGGFFPSGHAATAAVAYGAAVLLLFGRPRWPVLLGLALLNTCVGVGLVRCGYHWPLDVLGAWCLSGMVLWCLGRVLPGGPGASAG